jgi:hypothetical protein
MSNPHQAPDDNLPESKRYPEMSSASPPQDRVLRVSLEPSARRPTAPQQFDVAVRNRTGAIGFLRYKHFIDRVLGDRSPIPDSDTAKQPGDKREEKRLAENALIARFTAAKLSDHLAGVAAYDLLKTATEIFLLLECGVDIRQTVDDFRPLLFKPDEESGRLRDTTPGTDDAFRNELTNKLTTYLGNNRLPYITRVLQSISPDVLTDPGRADDSPYGSDVQESRIYSPCLLELIWSYWHEEGMLVQSLNTISLRFQNRRGPDDRNQLGHLTLEPLRPLSNILWGYIQDEYQRLTVARRAYEYDNHYGLRLYGRAVPDLRSADSRAKFLPAFHELLYRASVFFKEDDDTTRFADAFPLLRALREVHLLLAEGAHNQFGDLPWTARAEMLLQQWIMARQEIRDFLQSRPMVPYAEPWMPQVETLKKLMGWSDVSVSYYRDLAVYGEQLLLTIRYGDWIDLNDPTFAANWVRYWRPEIQTYIHAYNSVTGVDLSAPVTEVQRRELRDVLPSEHIRRQLEGRREPNGRAQAAVEGAPAGQPALQQAPEARQITDGSTLAKAKTQTG